MGNVEERPSGNPSEPEEALHRTDPRRHINNSLRGPQSLKLTQA